MFVYSDHWYLWVPLGFAGYYSIDLIVWCAMRQHPNTLAVENERLQAEVDRLLERIALIGTRNMDGTP
jgi:hypothetical protein